MKPVPRKTISKKKRFKTATALDDAEIELNLLFKRSVLNLHLEKK